MPRKIKRPPTKKEVVAMEKRAKKVPFLLRILGVKPNPFTQ